MRKLNNFQSLKKKYFLFLKKQEISGEPFFNKLGQLKNFYIPICDRIYEFYTKRKKSTILGLAGGQGSGKSTIAKILKIILEQKFDLNVLIISIDDYYKTLKERKKISSKNKLFLTRGVPGTHDVKLLYNHLNMLKKRKYKPFLSPKFDKSKDDRLNKKNWRKISKIYDIIIFEGWCVGANHQKNIELKTPINTMEKKEDIDLTWRKKVNNELKKNYKKIFKLINFLIFLKVPSFNYVYKWRLLQEKKLKIKSSGRKIMNNLKIKRFIMFYERITKNMLKDLKRYNVVIRLDKKHRLKKVQFN